MFRIPEGWTSRPAADATILEHPAGGAVHLWTQPLALARIEELVPPRWESLGFERDGDETRRALSTASGATACIVRADGRSQGSAVRGALAFVVLPDSVVAAGGVAPAARAAELDAAVREVAASYEAADAPTQRFLYAPPPSWHGRAQREATLWYAPAFPRVRATITVSPAERRPSHGMPSHVYDAIVAADARNGFVREQGDGPAAISSRFGLGGSAWSILGIPRGMARLCRDIVVLSDEHYVYTFILSTISPADRESTLPALRTLVHSARPVRGFDELVIA